MNPPNWNNCTESELWRYVAWHLEDAGIPSVLVGGAVVSIYTEGIYKSGDIDLIPDDFQRVRIAGVLGKIGFLPGKSRYFRHPLCKHLVVEFPQGPISLGDECRVTSDELVVEGKVLRLLSPTDCVKDRLAAYIHWGSRDCLDQAVLVCQAQKKRVDLENVAAWCLREGSMTSFENLISRIPLPTITS